MDLNNVNALKNWEKWKETLRSSIHLGETVGFSESTIDSIAYRVGNVLNSTIDPENMEERLLKELWDVGSEEDRRTLAKLVVKMVEEE